MADLPLIGGHAPGTSEKAHPETCVNLYIENRGGVGVLRNRPGYERYGDYGITPNAPLDQLQEIDSITVAAGTATLFGNITNIRYGYEVGDVITITGATTETEYNDDWTITAVNDNGESFSFDSTENGGTPGDENSPTAAQVRIQSTASGPRYRKEVRILQRYDSTATAGVWMRAVIGNRVYEWTHLASAWAEVTTPAHRFVTTKGPVAGGQLGDSLTDGIILCDGVSATMEGVTGLTLTYTGGAWSSSALSVLSNTVAFMDGYLIRDDKGNTGRFIYSDLYDASAENSFNFATAEGAPDDVIGVLSDRRELWLFGEYTTEIWFNAGGKDLPFQRFQGGFIETGIAASLTAKRFDNSVAWLAQDRRGGLTVVRAGEGFQPQMISTEQINSELNKRAEYVANAFAIVIRYQGHEFYILTIPGYYGITPPSGSPPASPTPITLTYDSNSKEWAKWESHDDLLATENHGRFFMSAHVFMYDTDIKEADTTKGYENGHIIGGRDDSGEVYVMREDQHLDEHYNGAQVIECERTLPSVEGPDFMRVNAGPIELVTDADATENISVDLSYAKDGKTFGSAITRSVTNDSSRLMWKKVGRARRWIFRVAQDTTATLPVRWLRLISRGLGK